MGSIGPSSLLRFDSAIGGGPGTLVGGFSSSSSLRYDELLEADLDDRGDEFIGDTGEMCFDEVVDFVEGGGS